jgi:hypothetical protein
VAAKAQKVAAHCKLKSSLPREVPREWTSVDETPLEVASQSWEAESQSWEVGEEDSLLRTSVDEFSLVAAYQLSRKMRDSPQRAAAAVSR